MKCCLFLTSGEDTFMFRYHLRAYIQGPGSSSPDYMSISGEGESMRAASTGIARL